MYHRHLPGAESVGVVLGVLCHRSTTEMSLSLLFPKATGLRDFLASILTFSLLLAAQASIFWAIWHSWSSRGLGRKQHAQTRHSEKHFQRCGQETTRGTQERAHSSPGVWGHRHPGSEGEGKVPTGSCEDRNPTGAVDSGSQRQPAFVRLKLRNMYSSTILFPPSVYCQCAQGTRLKVRGPRRHWCCPHPSASWVERRSEELRVDLEGPVEGSSTARLLLWEEHAASKGPLQVRPQAQRHMHSDLWTLCPQEGCVHAFVYVCAHMLAW